MKQYDIYKPLGKLNLSKIKEVKNTLNEMLVA